MREDDPVTRADTDEPPSPAAPGPQPALERYRSRMRRARIVYFSVVGAVVVALLVVAAVAWSQGEAAHATLRTVSPAPSTVAIEAPSPTLRQAWRSSDRIALGVPQWGGTVITWSEHTVGGRDARSGRRTWAYTRTDRTVCTAAQAGGTTIAVFENHGNCDELGAFDSGTGKRRWTRTLDKDAKPISGRPAYQVLPYTFMVTSDTTIYAIDPVTGYDRWTYYRFGCHITGAVIGSAGALIGQSCSPAVKCAGLKFCARGPQLLLRDGAKGNGSDSEPNRDNVKWLRRGDAGRPASADAVVSALDPDGRTLHVYATEDGNPLQPVALQPAATAGGPIAAAATSSAEVIWYAGRTYAVQVGRTVPNWTADTSSPPTVASTTDEQIPTLGSARIVVPLPDGIGLLDGNDGRVAQRFAVSVPQDSAIYSLGTGFLVTSGAGITAYR